MDNEALENLKYIKRFISQMERTFDDAKTCRKCSESCGDIFYNSCENTKKAISFIENEISKSIDFEKTLEKQVESKINVLEDAQVTEEIEFFKSIKEEYKEAFI